MNRATHYGDGIFETLRIANGKTCFTTAHYARMLHGSTVLGLENAILFSEHNFNYYLQEYIQRHTLINARVRIQLSRVGAMGYACDSQETELSTSHQPLATATYSINTTPYAYGVYTNNYKTCTELSTIKTTSALLYVLAGNYALANNCNEALLINEQGNVAEGYKSNVFIVKDNAVLTPPLSQGALNGVMRKVILNTCVKHNIPHTETSLSLSDISSANEIWFTNVIQGICCASTTNTLASQILGYINAEL
jgi:branched-chain amino acid aminotransferase